MNWYKKARRNLGEVYTSILTPLVFDKIKEFFLHSTRAEKEYAINCKKYNITGLNYIMINCRVGKQTIMSCNFSSWVNTIYINFQIDPTGEYYLSDIYQRINIVLRHEIEHALDTGTQMGMNYSDPNNDKTFENIRNYFMHPVEIRAYAVECYFTSKKTGMPLQQIIDEKIEGIKTYLNNSNLASKYVEDLTIQIKKAWYKYLQSRYPLQSKYRIEDKV